MDRFENQHFERVYEAGGHLFADLEFHNCQFTSCRLSRTRNPGLRSIVRNVKVCNCAIDCSFIDAAIVEEVLVDGLSTYANPPFGTWATLFKHVTFRGDIDHIRLNSVHVDAHMDPAIQPAFDEDRAAYYSDVDWALDISEAHFKEADIRGLEARFIRRDTATQAVVTRRRATEVEWHPRKTDGSRKVMVGKQPVDLSRTYWAGSIQMMLGRGDPDVVLVAPKRHRNYRNLLDGIKILRDVGIAEPG